MSARRRIPYLILPVLLLVPALAAAGRSPEAAARGQERPSSRLMAVTVDDVPRSGPTRELDRIEAMNRDLIKGFTRHGIPAVGFVNEDKLGVEGERGEREEREAILRAWVDAGLELGNHTYSHPDLNQTPLADFQRNVRNGEPVTRRLMEGAGGTLRWFRHPFLRTGEDLDKRRAFESWLDEQGYTIAPVTIENSDWMYNVLFVRARQAGRADEMARITDAYLAYTDSMLAFTEEAGLRIVGRPIPHVLLLHANELNAFVLDDLVERVRRRGYAFAPLEEVLEDPVYDREDVYTGPAGPSWLFRWDDSGDRVVDWRREPVPPDWVMAYDDYRP